MLLATVGTRRLVLLSAALALPVGASASACPGADAAALSWLDKMSRSLYQVSYHGVVTLQRGDDMQVMQVSHAVDGESSSSTLTQLTGQGAQVERRDHPLHCVHPGHNLLQLGEDLHAGTAVLPITIGLAWPKVNALPGAKQCVY